MKKTSKKKIFRMRNLLIVAGLAGSLLAGQAAFAAEEEGDYAEAENVLDIDPAYAGEVIDVTGYTLINDRLGFDDQENYYSFTAPVDGEYSFFFEPSVGLDAYNYDIKDEYGGMVAISRSKAKLGSYTHLTEAVEDVISLDEGMNYIITVSQYGTTYGKYSVMIDYPSSAQQFLDDFSQGIIIEDDAKQDIEDGEEADDAVEAEDSESSNEDLILQQLEEMQSRMDTLESEINEVKDENENLKNVLDENEIEYD